MIIVDFFQSLSYIVTIRVIPEYIEKKDFTYENCDKE